MESEVRDRDEEWRPPPALGLEPGHVLNGIYRIDSFVSRGGMGDVYAGVNVETDDKVAIKAMLPRLAADPKILSLFRSEARLLTRVSHPAVAQYRVFARDPTLGIHYLVTDFIDGEALSARLRGDRPDPAQVERLLRRLAGGLRVTHAIGAIHRDMSPDNILLPGGRIEDAKIIDFGIARYVEPDDRTVVVEGFAGKLSYVAPEQFGLFGNRIGPWTDIYSTALVTLAFARADRVDMGRTMAEAIERRRDIPDLDALPEALRPMVGAMLAPDPAARTASMDEVIAGLDSLGAAAAPSLGARWQEPTEPTRSIQPPKAEERAGSARRAVPVAASALAAGIAVVACVLLWVPHHGHASSTAVAKPSAPAARTTITVKPPLPSVQPAIAQALPPAPSPLPQEQPALAPVGLSVPFARRVLRAGARSCGPDPGAWSMAMVTGMVPGRDATLLFINPAGGVTPILSSNPPRLAPGLAGQARLRQAGHGHYAVSFCLHEPGNAAYALIGGVRDVPILSGGSAPQTAYRYRAWAAGHAGTARIGWLSIMAPAVAPEMVQTIPSPPPAGALASLPPLGFCRRFASGAWHDLGILARDRCIAAAFDGADVSHAQYDGMLIRRYAGALEVQRGGGWRRLGAEPVRPAETR